jgi:hypothetical protein
MAKKLTGFFYKCIQDSQEYGSNDEFMVSRVFFKFVIDDKEHDCYANLKQTVGSSFETGVIEVGPPVSYKGPFNYNAFRDEAEKYFRKLVGANASGIRVTGGSNIRMMNNTFMVNLPFEFDIPT